jgi:outer membrane protein OmpA-like peptidoglycan-associated protein
LCAILFPAAVAQAGISATINFQAGSARLDANGKDTLDEVAVSMKTNPSCRAQITGYGKPGETIQYFKGTHPMGEFRADAVKNYLVTRHGIDPARIATSGEDSTQSRSAVLTLSGQ